MQYTVDLHTHSSASDGQYIPSQLVELAAEKGIQVLALTDHDTIDGISQAVATGRKLGVQVIPGIELSAREYDTFHILGYGIDPGNSLLNTLCQERIERRNKRSELIIEYLATKGMSISLQEVEQAAGGLVIGRPHFAQVMLEKGYIADFRQAFDQYLDTEEYHTFTGNHRPAVQRCIEVIHAAGGKASLAHPYQLRIDDSALELQLRALTEMGLDAIECFYPKHTPEQTRFYLDLAQKYNLQITGGSDFHGEKIKPDIALAQFRLDLTWLGIE